MEYTLAALCVAFVFVCGYNDGGAMIVPATRHRDVAVPVLLGLLVAAVAAGPLLFGYAVARTFTDRLVVDGGGRGQLVVIGGVAVALVVVGVLTWRGLPTSLTLALLGGLAGLGYGLGLRPAWEQLGLVLAVAAAAPLAGGGLGYTLAIVLRRFPRFEGMPSAVRAAHVAAFAGQCLAYAANDAQKMYAVAAVALSLGATSPGPARFVELSLLWLVAVAVVFAWGTVTGMRRVARGATAVVFLPRPAQLVSAEVASAAAVLGSAGIGMPVSMTQSIAAGLIGTGASQGTRRVRWQYAVPILTAWVVTLPVSFTVAAVAGLALRTAT